MEIETPFADSRMRLAHKVLYCHGLGSSVENRTAQFLRKYFDRSGNYLECLKYRNPGSRQRVWRINEWKEDIENRIKDDEWIIIATSAGAHCALNAAICRPQNVKGLFMLCPGTALSLQYINNAVPNGLPILEGGGTVVHPASRNGHEALIDMVGLKQFMETCVSRREGRIPITCPVSLVHGTADTLVPYRNTIELSKRLASKDISLKIVDGGTHFLEMTPDVVRFLDEFLCKFATSTGSARKSKL